MMLQKQPYLIFCQDILRPGRQGMGVIDTMWSFALEHVTKLVGKAWARSGNCFQPHSIAINATMLFFNPRRMTALEWPVEAAFRIFVAVVFRRKIEAEIFRVIGLIRDVR